MNKYRMWKNIILVEISSIITTLRIASLIFANIVDNCDSGHYSYVKESNFQSYLFCINYSLEHNVGTIIQNKRAILNSLMLNPRKIWKCFKSLDLIFRLRVLWADQTVGNHKSTNCKRKRLVGFTHPRSE